MFKLHFNVVVSHGGDYLNYFIYCAANIIQVFKMNMNIIVMESKVKRSGICW